MSPCCFFRAFGTYALDEILGLFRYEAFREDDLGDAHVGQAEGPVAYPARQVDVTCAVQSVVVAADTIFVRTGAVVDVVKQVHFAEDRQGAEDCGLVDRRQRILEIGQAESAGERAAQLTENEKADRCDADSGLLKYLFVR